MELFKLIFGQTYNSIFNYKSIGYLKLFFLFKKNAQKKKIFFWQGNLIFNKFLNLPQYMQLAEEQTL